MLITSPSNTYSLNRMNSFETVVTPVRRNVARKSTANRPLFNTILKHSLIHDDLNDFRTAKKIVTEPFNISDYAKYRTHDFGLYLNNDAKCTSKGLVISEKEIHDSKQTMDFMNDSENLLSNEDSDDENDTSSGIFCVSEPMAKYLDAVFLSPSSNYDSSDESIDFSRVINYPVKLEKYSKSEETSENIEAKDISPSKEFEFYQENNNKGQEMLPDCHDTNKHAIASNDVIINNDCEIKELGTQTKKCLFDPNLQSVTCKVKVREEVLLCENMPLKMTILEANFDADQLENKVEESNYNSEPEDVNDNSFIPQVICAMSLGSGEKNIDEILHSDYVEKQKCSNSRDDKQKSTTSDGLEKQKSTSSFEKQISTSSDDIEKQKTVNKKPKKVTFKFSEQEMSDEVKDKRKTRSHFQVNNIGPKRTTRNSARLNRDSSPINVNDSDVNNLGNISCVDNSNNDKSLSIDDFKKLCENTKIPSVVLEKLDDFTMNEKLDCKKKCSLEKKGKKEINEGVLLHVEATKETELMRDGKIVKEKEEYLKDIESKIDKNLPVVVEKEYDIQQSLTEEILLDQALRSANQRSSPRFSKIVKEAILKAAIKKPSLKAKKQKIKKNKNKSKNKSNKAILSKGNDDSEAVDSMLNNSATSESASDVSSNSVSSNKSVYKKNHTNENNAQKKKKENYVVAPIIKNTDEEKVEPLTIKICRKTVKKKSAFRLSLKKKRSLNKKNDAITKPVKKTVNMDDLSKTFEDILQDNSWCSDGNEKQEIDLCDSKLPSEKEPITQNSSGESKDSNLGTIHSPSHKTENLPEKDVDYCNERDRGDKEGGNQISPSSPENLSSTFELPVTRSDSAASEVDGLDVGATPHKDSIKSGDNLSVINENNLFDKTLRSTPSKDIDERRNDMAESNTNLSSMCTSLGSDCIVNNLKNNVGLSNFSKPETTSNSTNMKSSVPSGLSYSEIPCFNGSPLRSYNTTPNHSPNYLLNEYVDKQMTDNSIPNNNQTISMQTQPYQEPAVEQPKCLFTTPKPITDLPPKVVPLSIASRDPRLRKSHVQLVLNVNTSSVSNSSTEKTEIRRETRIVSHVIENFSRDIDERGVSILETFTKDIDERINPASGFFPKSFDRNENKYEQFSKESDSRRDDDSGSDENEKQMEIECKKKIKKKEFDAELLYKTPLSDLHDIPERTSYNRSIRKRSPKIEKKDPKSSRWKDGNYSTNSERALEPYGEFHETNMIYSRITHSSVRRPLVNSEEMLSNDGFYPDYRDERPREPYPPDHYNSHKNEDYYQDTRRREPYIENVSSEYIHEVSSHSVHQNHPDLRRSIYPNKEAEHEHRYSENYILEYVPPEDNYTHGYKRSNEFCIDKVHRESPDYREKELVRERLIERNQSSHIEPSYSRWDYAHKKVEGHFPPNVDVQSKKEDNSQHNDRPKKWDEVRDLIDGPVKSFTRPFYRRKKFSRGEELFERRNIHWEVENRRYEDSGRNYDRPWVRKTDHELIHGPERERWERRSRKGFRDVREDRSRSPRRDHERYPRIHSRSPVHYHKSRKETSSSPHNSPLVLDSPMSPEPADRYCVLEPTKCLNIPQ